ncbi:uncharacterized protein LOC111090937 isoform X2 [Canis lupus familiaris]|uniref:uncharacterized protein LOC111090937 isoform X2 n=1 Tax=Canis lupus familiaris TaxID=9615 RepID=UPI0018F65B17|nr:uncharacterized protein LOC111090937 isoform X2 [Canis lupus familiaris]
MAGSPLLRPEGWSLYRLMLASIFPLYGDLLEEPRGESDGPAERPPTRGGKHVTESQALTLDLGGPSGSVVAQTRVTRPPALSRPLLSHVILEAERPNAPLESACVRANPVSRPAGKGRGSFENKSCPRKGRAQSSSRESEPHPRGDVEDDVWQGTQNHPNPALAYQPHLSLVPHNSTATLRKRWEIVDLWAQCPLRSQPGGISPPKPPLCSDGENRDLQIRRFVIKKLRHKKVESPTLCPRADRWLSESLWAPVTDYHRQGRPSLWNSERPSAPLDLTFHQLREPSEKREDSSSLRFPVQVLGLPQFCAHVRL